MSDLKYQKYILEDLVLPEGAKEHAAEYAKRATRILWLEDFVIKGAPNIFCSWYWKETNGKGSPSHTHDFDEVIGFLGGDPQNHRELYGEVEFWLEDEKYILDKSCFIYVPKGLRHCPLEVLKVDKPFLFLAFSLTSEYKKEGVIRPSDD
jgi:quercetin dioxygenase-like cupin family protein